MTYEDYGFCLYWDDLDEDLREEKIDKYLAQYTPEELKDMVGDPRVWAEEDIKRHFPMYF